MDESIVVNLAHVDAPKAGFLLNQLLLFKKKYNFHVGPIPGAQILVAVVLLLKWSSNLPPIQPRFHLLDLFAGGAAASKVWQLVEPINNLDYTDYTYILGSISSSFH